MLVTGICHHIKSNLINCYVCFLSFSYILYNPLILFVKLEAWRLLLVACCLKLAARGSYPRSRPQRLVDVHRASNVRFALAMNILTSRSQGPIFYWSQVHWIEAQRQLFTGAPGLNSLSTANRPGISSSCACVWLFATLHHNQKLSHQIRNELEIKLN